MGMDGIVFIRPAQNGASILDPLGSGKTFTKFVFNDGDGHTGYEREISLLLNEIDQRPHDYLLAVQEFVWSDYDPQYWVINGRSYPDTVLDDIDAGLPSQPISSRIDVNEGERMLMRISSLGYQQHSLILPGIPMRVVGEDATLLRGQTGADLSYWTNTLYIGPGESRDVIFDAPAHSGGVGPDVYVLRNHSAHKLTNGGASGPGGMQTEVRVYPTGTIPAQTSYP
jgi:FtsP/CotA-like multicopper oxidase with cupredoxin domain